MSLLSSFILVFLSFLFFSLSFFPVFFVLLSVFLFSYVSLFSCLSFLPAFRLVFVFFVFSFSILLLFYLSMSYLSSFLSCFLFLPCLCFFIFVFLHVFLPFNIVSLPSYLIYLFFYLPSFMPFCHSTLCPSFLPNSSSFTFFYSLIHGLLSSYFFLATSLRSTVGGG